MSFREIHAEVTKKIPKTQYIENDWCPIKGYNDVLNIQSGRPYTRFSKKSYTKKAWDRQDIINKRNGGSTWGHASSYLKPNRVRCPHCGRLLVPQVYNCEPFQSGGEYVLKIPPHKIKPLDRANRKRKRKKNSNKGCNK